MRIWVDADSCPVRVREIIVKACHQRKIVGYFVANRTILKKTSRYSKQIVTSSEEQAADKCILASVCENDLVITRDIPLAYELVQKGIFVLNDRGTIYTKENVAERLSIRNFMFALQSYGLTPERTERLGKREIQDFANSFDTMLTRLCSQNSDL